MQMLSSVRMQHLSFGHAVKRSDLWPSTQLFTRVLGIRADGKCAHPQYEQGCKQGSDLPGRAAHLISTYQYQVLHCAYGRGGTGGILPAALGETCLRGCLLPS